MWSPLCSQANSTWPTRRPWTQHRSVWSILMTTTRSPNVNRRRTSPASSRRGTATSPIGETDRPAKRRIDPDKNSTTDGSDVACGKVSYIFRQLTKVSTRLMMHATATTLQTPPILLYILSGHLPAEQTQIMNQPGPYGG